jgi:hypothetical protein
MCFCTNPPWTDKILKTHWAALERRVGAAGMPVSATEHKDLYGQRQDLSHMEARLAGAKSRGDLETVAAMDREIPKTLAKIAKLERTKNKGYREFGSGHYGTVMPTGTPGMVIKITTDTTEAAFVAAYLSMPKNDRPAGIIPYRKLLAIRSESHLKRPVFVLWRDEAQTVGSDKIDRWIRDGARDFEREYLAKSFRAVKQSLGNCLDAAREVRRLVLKKPDAKELLTEGVNRMDEAWDRGHPPRAVGGNLTLRLGWYLSVFYQNSGSLQNEQMGNYVGQALEECFKQGLLLADVHLNNIGMPTGELLEEIGMTPIITDPGHAIALDDRFATVAVEEL